jgi:hypothetical protein
MVESSGPRKLNVSNISHVIEIITEALKEAISFP